MVGVGVRVKVSISISFALGWFFLRYKNGNLILKYTI